MNEFAGQSLSCLHCVLHGFCVSASLKTNNALDDLLAHMDVFALELGEYKMKIQGLLNEVNGYFCVCMHGICGSAR